MSVKPLMTHRAMSSLLVKDIGRNGTSFGQAHFGQLDAEDENAPRGGNRNGAKQRKVPP